MDEYFGPLSLYTDPDVDPKMVSFIEHFSRPLLNMFNHFLALDIDFD